MKELNKIKLNKKIKDFYTVIGKSKKQERENIRLQNEINFKDFVKNKGKKKGDKK